MEPVAGPAVAAAQRFEDELRRRRRLGEIGLLVGSQETLNTYVTETWAPTHAVTLSPDLKSADGQTLGYTWLGIADNWHMRAFTSFGDGEGVWEKDGGAQLPFYARNMVDITQWAQPVATGELMPLLVRLRQQNFRESPSGAGIMRKIGGTPDRIQSHGLDLSKSLRPSGSGIVWASVRR